MTPPKKLPDIPGANAALPAGSLPGPYLGPHSDENRDPPPNSPAPVNPVTLIDQPEDDDPDHRTTARPGGADGPG